MYVVYLLPNPIPWPSPLSAIATGAETHSRTVAANRSSGFGTAWRHTPMLVHASAGARFGSSAPFSPSHTALRRRGCLG